MKRIGYIYEKICDKNNITEAIKNASKGKKKRKYVAEINKKINVYVNIIQGILLSKSYIPGVYNKAIIKDKRFQELFLLQAAQTRDKSAVNEEQMKELTSKLKEEFDYVLIDCPAGIEQGFKNAVSGADRAIVVTTAEISAIRDADRIIGLLEASEIKNPEFNYKWFDKNEIMNSNNIIESDKKFIEEFYIKKGLNYLKMDCYRDAEGKYYWR